MRESGRFIVVTPPYTRRSNGIHTLHVLCDALNRSGHDATLMIMDAQGLRRPRIEEVEDRLITPGTPRGEIDPKAIVIYPEIVTANLLNAPRVVWYLLNRDGELTGRRIQASPIDYFVAQSARFEDPRVRHVLHSFTPHPSFHGEGSIPWGERQLDLTYVGKGAKYGPCYRVEGSVMISREWPDSPDQVAQLLRHARYLYTWDAWSQINSEAVLCGAMPRVMRWGPWELDDLRKNELSPPIYTYGALHEPVEFIIAQVAFLARAKKLQESWKDRVAEFADRAIEYFNGVE